MTLRLQYCHSPTLKFSQIIYLTIFKKKQKGSTKNNRKHPTIPSFPHLKNAR